VLGNQQHSTTPSIGITLFSGDALTHQELLKRADTAMYEAKAKAKGRNQLQFFE
jgi:GGDEF domain-containing protein